MKHLQYELQLMS